MLSTELSASLRQMAAAFPLTDDEQRTLRSAAEMLERIKKMTASMPITRGLMTSVGVRSAIGLYHGRLTTILDGK